MRKLCPKKISNEEFKKVLGRRYYWYIHEVKPWGKGISISVVCGQELMERVIGDPFYFDKTEFFHVSPPGLLDRFRGIKTITEKVNRLIDFLERYCYRKNLKQYEILKLYSKK